MAKNDTAKEIASEFSDKGYEAEKLAAENTQTELDELQAELRAAETVPAALLEETKEPETKANKMYRLKDPKTSYQEVGFTLADDQEKELPENPSSFLTGRIKSGFIVEVK